MNEDQALRIVAARALWQLLETDRSYSHTDWGDYPDIGEYDWYRVLELMDELTPDNPTSENFDAAYTVLAARAEHSA